MSHPLTPKGPIPIPPDLQKPLATVTAVGNSQGLTCMSRFLMFNGEIFGDKTSSLTSKPLIGKFSEGFDVLSEVRASSNRTHIFLMCLVSQPGSTRRFRMCGQALRRNVARMPTTSKSSSPWYILICPCARLSGCGLCQVAIRRCIRCMSRGYGQSVLSHVPVTSDPTLARLTSFFRADCVRFPPRPQTGCRSQHQSQPAGCHHPHRLRLVRDPEIVIAVCRCMCWRFFCASISQRFRKSVRKEPRTPTCVSKTRVALAVMLDAPSNGIVCPRRRARASACARARVFTQFLRNSQQRTVTAVRERRVGQEFMRTQECALCLPFACVALHSTFLLRPPPPRLIFQSCLLRRVARLRRASNSLMSSIVLLRKPPPLSPRFCARP